MRTHQTLNKIPKVCYHGISMDKNCEKCIRFFIGEKETEIKILKQKLSLIKKDQKINYCILCNQMLKFDKKDLLWYCMNKSCLHSKKIWKKLNLKRKQNG